MLVRPVTCFLTKTNVPSRVWDPSVEAQVRACFLSTNVFSNDLRDLYKSVRVVVQICSFPSLVSKSSFGNRPNLAAQFQNGTIAK